MIWIRYLSFAGVALTAAPAASAFTQPTIRTTSSTNLQMSSPLDPEQLKQMQADQSLNSESMKASAEMLKNLKPSDIEMMLTQMDNMPAEQKKQMEAMGMNPALMRQSVEMMKANPQMAQQMSSMMETMTPEEIMEKSRESQATFEADTPPSSIMEAQLVNDDDDDEDDENTDSIPTPEPSILDTLYQTAELMSTPPTGKVTLAGFSTIPPIALLVGTDSDRDLSQEELNDCWADGSLGSNRVDRAGFERVWIEVQEYFSLPVMDKARERTTEGTTAAASPAAPPQVGQTISPEQLAQVKNMSDTDMDSMFSQMNDMSPETLARMKSMGVDPKMMQKTAELMNSNPLLREGAKKMMKNMSPEQMRAASQQAQEQMKNMSPEMMKEAMDKLGEQSKE